MPRIEYRRIDLAVRIEDDGEGGVTLTLAGQTWSVTLAPATLDRWTQDPEHGVPALRDLIDGAALDIELQRPVASHIDGDNHMLLRRLLLLVDAACAGYAWEAAMRAALPQHYSDLAIVRQSAVWPRAAGRAFTLPLRLLQIDAQEPRLNDIVDRVLGHFGAVDQAEAVQATTWAPEGDLRVVRFPPWPTADILHFDRLPTATLAVRAGIASQPEPGSADWLCRLAEVNQSRLVVLRAESAGHAVALRRLGRQVVDRGGPGVMVFAGEIAAAASFVEGFYDALIHDHPVDAAAATAIRTLQGLQVTLFGGAGREELLRVSSVGTGLLRVSREWLAPPALLPLDRLRRGAGRVDLELPSPASVRGAALGAEFDALRSEWDHQYRFDQSEGGGLMPMARRLRSLREAAGVGAVAPAESSSPQQPRHLHYALLKESFGMGTWDRLSELQAGLRVGQPIQLELQIAEGEPTWRIVEDAALLEEQFHWRADDPGRWLEIGVTPLDFDLQGAALQSLWLPRRGNSDALRFTVVPRKAGVALLRWTLYLGNEVLHSYRLAAVVGDAAGEAGPLSNPQAALAEALGVAPEQVRDREVMVRLEYSLAPAIDSVPERRQPVLSLVANDLQGRTAITLKSGSVFEVAMPAQAKAFVRTSRVALAEIEAAPIQGVPANRWKYSFAPDNSGSPVQLAAALRRLAKCGAELFNLLVPGDIDQKNAVREALDAQPGTIHVAHVLLQHLIPWALVYDRQYDEGQGSDELGRTIAPDVCQAPMQAGFGAARCGQHEHCALHAQRRAERLARDGSVVNEASVVCPRHFWGFGQIIELPPQQTDSQGEGPPLALTVKASPHVQMLRALNPAQSMAAAHERQLDALIQQPARAACWKITAYDRNTVKAAVADVALDLLYFYCHAEGGEDSQAASPQLLFGKPPGSLSPSQLQGKAWSNQPLVILNGCGTVAYSPDALSPFIDTLVRDRRAGGVLGTEIPVWEALATEVALLFLDAFIGGVAAGEALQSTRLQLLRKNNPMGLAYTLFAAADLRLELAGQAAVLSP